MEYFQPRFDQRLVLSLKSLVLGSEFNSLSNGIGLEVGHRRRRGGFSRNTSVFPKFMKYFQPRSFIENFILILLEKKHSWHPLHTDINLHVQIKIPANPLSITSYSSYIRLRLIRSITNQTILFQIESSRSHHTRPHENSTTLHHKLEPPYFKTNHILG